MIEKCKDKSHKACHKKTPKPARGPSSSSQLAIEKHNQLRLRCWIERLIASFTGPFRFADLPAELRIAIYKLLLPHGRTVSFQLKPSDHRDSWQFQNHVGFRQSEWETIGLRNRRDHDKSKGRGKDKSKDRSKNNSKDILALFTINQQIGSEARGEFPLPLLLLPLSQHSPN
jgi:hypothetical protein